MFPPGALPVTTFTSQWRISVALSLVQGRNIVDLLNFKAFRKLILIGVKFRGLKKTNVSVPTFLRKPENSFHTSQVFLLLGILGNFMSSSPAYTCIIKANGMHWFSNLFWWSTLYISDRSTVLHQESQHCIHSNRYLSYRLCWLSASEVILTSLADSQHNHNDKYVLLCSTGLRLLMMDSRSFRNT